MDGSLLHFVETAVFRRRLDKLTSIETLFALQNELLINPKRGDVIQGTGGARKARIASRQEKRGKSGSFRYIYLYIEKAETIYLLVFYAKNEKDSLSAAEKKQIAELVKILKDKYGESNNG